MRIIIDGYDTLEDLGLRYSNHTIASPEPVRMTVDVPFRNGTLDLTESLSDDMTYKNREIVIDFYSIDTERDWFSTFSMLYNMFHGRKMHVVFCDDAEWYWDCFCDLTSATSRKMVGLVTMTFDAYPYKLKNEETVVEIVGADTVTLTNNRMRVLPVVTSTDDAVIIFNESRIAISAGTFVLPSLQLEYGDNIIETEGNATITIKYREGSL